MNLNCHFLVGKVAAAVEGILSTLSFAQAKRTTAIITSSHDNPSFQIQRKITATGVAVSQIVSNSHPARNKLMREAGDNAYLVCQESDSNAGIRSKGYCDVIDHHPDLSTVSSQRANWSQSEAYTVMESIPLVECDVAGRIAPGIALVSEGRKRDRLVQIMAIQENLTRPR